jgi:hypothetical protein
MLKTPMMEKGPTERAAEYRKLAEEARTDAQRIVSREVREGYLLLAAEWERMAERALFR